MSDASEIIAREELESVKVERDHLLMLADESHAHLNLLCCPTERYGELLTVSGRIAWLREHLETVLEKLKESEANTPQ